MVHIGRGGQLMPLADNAVWSAGGAAFLGALQMIRRVWLKKTNRKESLEDRLQRWQEKIVGEVRESERACRAENEELRSKIIVLEKRDSRVFIIESCLRLLVVEVRKHDPGSPVLKQVETMLSAELLPRAFGVPHPGDKVPASVLPPAVAEALEALPDVGPRRGRRGK